MSRAIPIAPEKRNETCSVSIREIDNGFIIRHEEYDGSGEYKSNEVFSKTRPKAAILVNTPEEHPDGQSSKLKMASRMLNSRRK